MNLFLMRHCRAVPGARDDASRGLTDDGRKQAADMAAWLKGQIGRVDTVICSAFMRAIETAEIMAEALGANVQRTPMLDPDADQAEAWKHVEAIAGYCSDVLVVSHHPLVGHLLDEIAGLTGMSHTFEHGAIAAVDTYRKEMYWLVDPSLVEREDDELTEAAADLAEALVDVAEVDAPPLGGLKHARHAVALKPIRAKATRTLQRYFRYQEARLLKAIKPKLREADGKDKAAQIIPDPLPISITGGMSFDYSKALATSLTAGYGSLADEVMEDATPLPELSADVVQDYLADHSLTKLTGQIDPTTVQRLRSALADAYDAGADFEGLVDAVQETYADFNSTRAAMIAQTEMNAAYNAGRKQLGIDLGFNEKAWDPDGTACEAICVPNVLDGWIAIGEDFDSGDDAPPAHPNCDCSLNVRNNPDGK